MTEGPRSSRTILKWAVVAMVVLVSVVADLRAETPVSIEAEALLGWAEASEGELQLQDLERLGEGFRGVQLLWTPQREGARLRLDAPVGQRGRYEVLLVLTVAPDYGVIEMSLEGDLRVTLNAYEGSASRVRVSLGIHELEPGPHELVFRIAGKDPSSSGHRLGIDRIELVRLNDRHPRS